MLLEEMHSESDIVAAAQRIADRNLLREQVQAMTSPTRVREYLVERMRPLSHEEFQVMFLDNRHRVIQTLAMFRGTIDGASVYPREVARECIMQGAAAIIVAHNHPSGRAEPSHADERLTERLADALNLIDVRILDHIIVADRDTVSFAERGLI